MAFGTGDRGSRHPVEDGSTRESLSEECRAAALSFMTGVGAGWDKLDLALWLTGDYARATRHRKHGERVATPTLGVVDEIPAETLEALVVHVRGQLLASLEMAALELGALDFAEAQVARGLVRQMIDADGRDAWVPVDGARMRLRERLESLFAADYLNAPYTYAGMFVCPRCEAVVFDAHAKRTGICGIHRISDTVPREGGTPCEQAAHESNVA
jgi:hypothetical protein